MIFRIVSVDKIFSPLTWTILTYLLFTIYIFLAISTFLDYGITYDETWQSINGNHIIEWYTSLFSNDSALTYWKNLTFYGGFFDVTAQVAAKVSPIGVFETRHFINTIFGLLGLIGVYKLGKYLESPFVGFLSALFLIATPRFYGHAFNNPKDIPFAVLSLFALYYAIRSIDFLPHIPRGWWIKLGVALGLTLSIRVGGILLLFYYTFALGLWLFLRYSLEYATSTESKPDLKSDLLALGGRYLGICVTAYSIMLVWWPAAQVRPIVQPVKALFFSTKFNYTFDVFFEGRFVPNTELPWHYLPKWFWITLPELYLVALSAGLILASIRIVRWFREGCDLQVRQLLKITLLGLSIAFPITYAIIIGPVIYDGIRHFLFVVPPLAVVAAISVAKLLEWYPKTPATIGVVAALLVSLVVTVVDMVHLHPYQSVYFNRLLGKGMEQAAQLYDTDYWGNSYKEAVEWLVANYEYKDTETPPKVASCSYATSTSYFLPKNSFQYVGSYHDGQAISTKPDILLATPRWDCHNTLEGTVIHTVSRLGAPLLYIIKVSE